MNNRIRHWGLTPAIAVGGLALATACGASAATTPGAAGSPTPTAAAASGATTEATSIGTVLANSGGRTLYFLTSDKPGHLACTGGCYSLWPPAMVSAAPTDGHGITATFATIKIGTGSQLTVDGHPAYTFAGDSAAGQSHGEGIQSYGGTWYAFGPAGSAVAPSRTAGSSSTSPAAGGGNGY